MPENELARRLMQSPIGILSINWVFQGTRGMQSKELSFRLCFELFLILILGVILVDFLHPIGATIASFFASHSINWLFNTHLWVCVRYFPIYRRDPGKLSHFLKHTEKNLKKIPWLQEAVCIGSVGDHNCIRTARSDIDLRLIFPPGAFNWIRVNFLLLRLRTSALFRVIPLDLYAYNDISNLDRFSQTEKLRIILDREGKVTDRYKSRIYES